MTTTQRGVLRAALLCGTTAFVAAATFSPAYAQSEGGAQTLEEIVVTAQKRAERLQDTPISVTAFTEQAIAQSGATNVQELSELAPNVTFDFTAPVSGASNAAVVYIRGIGQSDFALTTEAGVGTYVDGVYMSRSLGGVLDVLDIERMEILSGPQGTLFGRNTIGGAINIITLKPADDFGGKLEVTGGTQGQVYLRGTVSIPFTDDLGLRLSASSKDRDGWVKSKWDTAAGRVFYPAAEEHDYGNENRQAVRGVLNYTPTDTLELSLSADYARVREQNAPSVLRGTTSTMANGPVAFVYNTFEAPLRSVPGFANAAYTDANWVTGDPDKTWATGPNGTRLDSWGTALTATWRLSPALELKSITAYRHTDGAFNRDADGSPIDLTHTQNYDYQHRQFSEELQLVGDLGGGRLKYVAGLYYFNEDGQDPLIVKLPPSFGTIYIDQAKVENSSVAGYVQATFEITERLNLTAGVRYTEDEKEFRTDQYLVTGTASPIVFGVPAGTAIPLVPRNSVVSSTYDDTSPHVSLDFKAARDLLLYASYSKGFKSGGFNLRYVQPRAGVLSFSPERVNTYEAGFKWEGFGRRVRLNAAAFHTDYEDVQLTVFENLGAPVTLNGGDAEINGGEVELTATPMSGLQLSASAGYTDAEYTRIAQSAAVIATPEQRITTATKLPNVPEWQANVSGDYTIDLDGLGSVKLYADAHYTAEVFNDAQNSRYLRQGAYTIWNAGITYAPESKQWSVRAFADNIGDKRYIVSGDSNFGIGFHEASYNRPRSFGATLTINF